MLITDLKILHIMPYISRSTCNGETHFNKRRTCDVFVLMTSKQLTAAKEIRNLTVERNIVGRELLHREQNAQGMDR